MPWRLLPSSKDVTPVIGDLAWRDMHIIENFSRLHRCPNFRTFKPFDETSKLTLLFLGVQHGVPDSIKAVNFDHNSYFHSSSIEVILGGSNILCL